MQLEVPRSPAPPVWLPSVHSGAPHAPISQLPRTVPEQTGRDGHLTAEGRVPRAQRIKAKTIKINSAVAAPAVPPPGKAAAFPGVRAVRSPSLRCPPGPKCTAPPRGHVSFPPREGATAPRLGPLMVEELQRVSPLCRRWEKWAALAASPWVLKTISRGYRLQFAAVPPRFAGIIHSQAQGESARVLQEEILSLLNKGAICVVPPAQCQSGFYSRYFLVPKRGGGGIRPILDLRALNKFLRKYKFRMLTHASLLRLVRQNDFHPGKSVQFRLCLRLLGLMASAILVVRLGRLHMREFQLWVASCGRDPVRHGARRVLVTPGCVRALRHWRAPYFLTRGVPMGSVLSRTVVTTDASLTGWGGIHEGRSMRGRWSVDLQRSHINFLELSAVFLSLKHFLPSLMGHHVLVRTDNTTTVTYINRQGGLRSRQLHMLARRLILWSCGRLLSLRATHVPGALNTGADLLSRGAPVYGEWTLHPVIVEQIWARYGRAAVDLFASRGNAQCALFYSLRSLDAPLGIDALAHVWPHELLYAFPPLALLPPTLSGVRDHGHALILIAPHWPAMHWLAEIYRLLCAQPWQLPLRRDLLSQGGGAVFHPHPERLALWVWPLSGSICQRWDSHSV
ncbi:uncharacterized protein LOC128357652 [Scomber japonicus]|uniref:uncharacterized protein LOC128357652 n=1 Tax=Scomber japonicus TaxID=13676 RepID=UPI002306572F|nr:uncharacterized protein LOC128357652 [Scomber japonicus]